MQEFSVGQDARLIQLKTERVGRIQVTPVSADQKVSVRLAHVEVSAAQREVTAIVTRAGQCFVERGRETSIQVESLFQVRKDWPVRWTQDFNRLFHRDRANEGLEEYPFLTL